ncbi:MAG TPA: tRNA preQ1(34) S-adenosylmethionine ribosyltransferase-isomerase QueA [Thermoclostridium caenicola]|uniref:tRNA preQ1(34) S-adenosylmethionine ribosyltransferase-isomerase QueA n=1 Tax=Thermoclostridium caenicola TaxID=659425 RepID=UPI002CC56DAD|nr:tRNA preQ1(34) S-adenosylmethionine ribosyltransferase-isomerase QueA [Thermoclostridium caenicola]HOK44101.1 tRNA preQ1(34) S-adenosylmethionine ribosyltransferase-isomerase QueA [Thermoclostridium caenicola]HOL84684.1 tRNA preQ1(34) S-adenosylmethionine ribosyltransferase-isomerase QueA [Thermoclostridium caenicola]HPO76613.1 tRNA preQ1(34) S-adenosylmethionine ribosyltransferase-isomerase QueA [Thermoclostridium caenicola]
MNLKDFWYPLPKELIAQHPLERRDQSRLLVLDREKQTMTHRVFRDIQEYLRKGDCLVINNTRVIPARLLGEKEGTGGKIEFVLLKRLENDVWEVILKPGRRAKPGSRFAFGDGRLMAEILRIADEGNRIVRFYYDGVFEEVLDQVGIMPLPPYITENLEDRERYQTVYSKVDGSAAAPTAGLHFTEELLELLKARGVEVAEVTLHVGLGTFRPVKVENILEHHMHKEFYSVSEKAAEMINRARESHNRVIAVGTTSVRVLETVADDRGMVSPGQGETDIFIYPGYKFKAVDALITNFHLPESTLMMLVCAFAGRDFIMRAYQEAIEQKYRFFSFGDAMFVY